MYPDFWDEYNERADCGPDCCGKNKSNPKIYVVDLRPVKQVSKSTRRRINARNKYLEAQNKISLLENDIVNLKKLVSDLKYQIRLLKEC